MEQSFPTTISVPRPSLGARLTSSETHGAAQELARLGVGLGARRVVRPGSGGARGECHWFSTLAASAGLATVAVLGIPALFVLLALVNAPRISRGHARRAHARWPARVRRFYRVAERGAPGRDHRIAG